jgi:ribosomal protein S3/ribosomal protein L22
MQLETQEFRAEAKFQRVSPQKARLVLELIKGRRVGEALETVAFTKKGVAPLVEKVLRAAIQNANYLSQERDLDLDVDNLYVKTALANEGPRMKRIRPAPMGRAFRYQRRMSHIVISVAERKRGGWWKPLSRKPRRRRSALKGRGQKTAAKKTKWPRRAQQKTGRRPRSRFEEIMGQKVHPYGFRLGVNKPWRSRWFVERDYDKLLIEDVHLRAELKEKLKAAGVSSVEIERPGNKLRLIIRTARPGIVIGRKGAEIEKLKLDLQKRTNRDVFIDILEVNKPELDAQLVAENIALQLEKRVGFRRAMRKAVDSALRFGCKGIKVRVSGR